MGNLCSDDFPEHVTEFLMDIAQYRQDIHYTDIKAKTEEKKTKVTKLVDQLISNHFIERLAPQDEILYKELIQLLKNEP